MNTADLANMMRIFQAAYPHAEVTDEQYELWYQAFEADGPSAVLAAANTYVTTQEFFPTIAGIRSIMSEQARQQAREATMYTRMEEPGTKYPSIAEGRAIAAMAYEKDCIRQGREPNWDWWNQAMGLVGQAQKSGRYR